MSAITAMPNPLASVTEQVASPDQVCGHEIEPHNTRDTKSFGTPPVNGIISSNRFQQIQLPLTQQINSQEPVKFQLTHPVQQSKQEPVQLTRPVRILDQDIVQSITVISPDGAFTLVDYHAKARQWRENRASTTSSCLYA